MTLTINGESRALPPDVADVAALLRHLRRHDSRGVAVAINGEVVRRADWSARSLRDGDRVDIVGAVQGG